MLSDCEYAVESHEMFGGKVWNMLIKEAGDTFEDQRRYVECMQRAVNDRYEEIRAARFSNNKQEDQGSTSPDLAEADEYDEVTHPGRSQDDVMISAETPTDSAVAVGDVQGVMINLGTGHEG